MSNNGKSTSVTFNTVLRAKAFREGVVDYRAGLSHRDVENIAQNKIWEYEWGRQFAALFPDWTEKRLRPIYGKVDEVAVGLFIRAYIKGWILNV